MDSETAEVASSDGALIALIKDLTAKIGAMETKLAQTSTAAPRMIPMGAMDVPNIGTVAANMSAGDERAGSRQLPISSRGLRLHDDVFRQFDQLYQPGQQVRINRDVIRDGASKPWGEILDKLGTVNCPTKVGRTTCRTPMMVGGACPRCGVAPTVQCIYYLDKQGEWKYGVRVPGLTQRQGKGQAFAQSELLPA